jgi:hypothetical protein
MGCGPFDKGIGCSKGEYVTLREIYILANFTLETYVLETILMIGLCLAD